ncbi:hypothetical protein X797_009701 [Metarhizium robertsii]|uniref:Uncharacterized protein n=1 Tax=Metarhizium robertsii TaxID=568076 RepID=A0A0A1UP78_9HYPO|nr:hypothetical protein X797_009701 [Metarhizium robertsii]
MKIPAATVIIIGSAAALPQAAPPPDLDTMTKESVICELYDTDPQNPGVENLSQVCNKHGGCSECTLAFARQGRPGIPLDVTCKFGPRSAGPSGVEFIDSAMETVCKQLNLDGEECRSYKHDCLYEASKAPSALFPQFYPNCIGRREKKNRNRQGNGSGYVSKGLCLQRINRWRVYVGRDVRALSLKAKG